MRTIRLSHPVVTEADLRQAALGLHLDLSDILLGGNKVRVWDLKEDNSFMAYDLYLDENYEFAADSLSGIWKTFVNASVQWDVDETIPLNGISVIYEWGVGISGAESVAQRYFGFNESDEETEAVDKNSLFFGSPYLCTIKRFIRFLRYSFFILLLVIWLDLIKVRSGEP